MKYINNLKVKESKFGLKVSGNLEKLIEELKPLVNEKGYFNLEINKRKEVGQYGETHSVKVDEFKPTPKAQIDPTEDLPF